MRLTVFVGEVGVDLPKLDGHRESEREVAKGPQHLAAVCSFNQLRLIPTLRRNTVSAFFTPGPPPFGAPSQTSDREQTFLGEPQPSRVMDNINPVLNNNIGFRGIGNLSL
jgi:hypothetical protein